MDISCEVIQDLLPLYAEDLVSVPTRELVEGHLCQCEGCTRELNSLKKTQTVPVNVGIGALQRVKHSIKVRKMLTVLAVLATLLSVVLSVCVFMVTPIYLPADKAIEDVYLQEDGALVIDYARGYVGSTGIGSPQGGMEFFCSSNRFEWLKGRCIDRKLESMTQAQKEEFIKERYQTDVVTKEQLDRFYDREKQYYLVDEQGVGLISSIPLEMYPYLGRNPIDVEKYSEAEHDYDIAYLKSDGTVDTFLWNGTGSENGLTHCFDTGTYLWAEAFFGSIVAAIALFTWHRFSKKPREWQIILSLALGSIAYTVGLVSNCSFDFAALQMSHAWMEYVTMEAPVVFFTAVLWRQIFRLKKQDKGL